MPPERVLRIVTRLNRGGPLRQLRALVPGLAAEGWEGPVLAGVVEDHEVDGTASLQAAGADVLRVPSLCRGLDPARDGRALRALLREVHRVRPAIVHTHLGKAGALGRLAGRAARVPVVHTFHGHHLRAPWPRGALARAAERSLAPLASAVVCLTPRQAEEVVALSPRVLRGRVHVVAPGLDTRALRDAVGGAGRGDVARRFDTARRPLFVWAGRFVSVKDPLLFVRAVAASERAFQAVMLGDGPLRARVEDEIRARGLANVLSCPGSVAEPAPWIAAADAVVLSSRSEGTPLLVLEAKVLGRPSIVTTVGGVPEVVEHGEDGWWVAPGSESELARALDLFAADRQLARRLGATAVLNVDARYGRTRLARETAEVYARVLGRA